MNRIGVVALILGLASTAFRTPGQVIYEPYAITTFAGMAGVDGESLDGTGSAARFTFPRAVAVDAAENIYVADSIANTIRKITAGGVVTTLAGTPGTTGNMDGTALGAKFNAPTGLAVDAAGIIYVADRGNRVIRTVTPAGLVTTLARSGGTPIVFSDPTGVAVDGSGNIYVAERNVDTIRKVSPSGELTTLAGLDGVPGSADGTGSAARFSAPFALAVDSSGNVFVADSDNNSIRKVTPTGVVSTLAVIGRSALIWGTPFYFGLTGVSVDANGNVYLADGASTIQKISPLGSVTTLAGLSGVFGNADGLGNVARFYYPASVAVDSSGTVYVAEFGNSQIRKVSSAGEVTTLAGVPGSNASIDATGSRARFNGPASVAVDATGNLYVADDGNSTIRKVTPAGDVSILAGIPGSPGSEDGIGAAARFSHPLGVTVDSAGNVYVADRGNRTIRKVTPGGAVTTLAGLAGAFGSIDGRGGAARFGDLDSLTVDRTGNVYAADSSNFNIRKVTPDGDVTTLAGLAGVYGNVDGTGTEARFQHPTGVAADSGGNLYLTDSDGTTIRKVTPAGVVTTLAGLAGVYGTTDGVGSTARFGLRSSGPATSGTGFPGVAVDNAGNLYVADSANNTIRKVTAAGVVTTLAGQAFPGYADGTGNRAQFYYPQGIAVDAAGNIYVADESNNTIRKGSPPFMILASEFRAGFKAGNFEFSLTAPPSKQVVIDASANLIEWQPVWTNMAGASLDFSDRDAGSKTQRFYRARTP